MKIRNHRGPASLLAGTGGMLICPGWCVTQSDRLLKMTIAPIDGVPDDHLQPPTEPK